LVLYTLFSYLYRSLVYLHSFPTRRSSDLHSAWRDPSAPPRGLQAAPPSHRDCFRGLDFRHPNRRRGPMRHRRLFAILRGLPPPRSEEHTSELQSRENLVCRLLLEKKNLTT